MAAESKIYALNSWQSIYNFYKTYGLCDDGGVAEGISDRTVHLLVTQWETLTQVRQLIAQDPKFEMFFLKHINASADTLELDRIVLIASQQCLPQDLPLCKKIAEAASER
jgi:hypothetical protein